MNAELSTYLVAALSDIGAAGEQTVLQDGTALGHRHTLSTAVHHVECGAVFSIYKTVYIVHSYEQLHVNTIHRLTGSSNVLI